MLCAGCYGGHEEESLLYQTPVKSGWVHVRLAHRFALERRRWVVLRVGGESASTLSYYSDSGCRRALGNVPLDLVEVVGDVPRSLRLGSSMTLRFDSLEEKLEWWRRLRTEREVSGGRPSSAEEDDGGGLLSEASTRRRRSFSSTLLERPRASSECDAGDGSVVWEAHGMCVVDSEGRLGIEPRPLYSAKVAYGKIVKAFIRPPRAEYDTSALGPKNFSFAGAAYARRDGEARNERGRLVRYSVWRLDDEETRVVATVVYAHGNASSRVEGLSQLALCLSLHPGVQFIALDCCGSGRSEGEFVSLGLKEQEDVVAVLDAERACYRCCSAAAERDQDDGLGKLVLWGRSMGAVTSLLVASTREPDVAAVVCDSAYSSLKELSLDVARRGAEGIPSFIASSALRWVRDSVFRRAAFDLFEVDALKHVRECVAPVFFVCAADDTFVDPSHTSRLHEALVSSKKELCVCPGTHNSTRPKECFDRIEIFLRSALGLAAADDKSPPRDYASSLDQELLPMLPQSRRQDRPNFAALAPWTIENLRARRRAGENSSETLGSSSNGGSESTTRWLCQEEERGQAAVEEM